MADIQEVQTPVTPTTINTLETIEAIGTSSRKIIIGRQTREKIYGESGVTLSLTIDTPLTPREETDDLRGDPVVSDEVGELSYTKVGDGVRVPLAGNYSLTVTSPSTAASSSGYVYPTVKVWAGREKIYEYTNTVHSTYTETVMVSLGRFDVLSMTIKFDDQSTYNSISRTATFTLEKL